MKIVELTLLNLYKEESAWKNPYPSPYLKGIQNVVLAGQWFAAPGGLPGAAIQGKYAVQRVLKKEKQSQKKKKRNLEA